MLPAPLSVCIPLYRDAGKLALHILPIYDQKMTFVQPSPETFTGSDEASDTSSTK
jgi:hypothetical protein